MQQRLLKYSYRGDAQDDNQNSGRRGTVQYLRNLIGSSLRSSRKMDEYSRASFAYPRVNFPMQASSIEVSSFEISSISPSPSFRFVTTYLLIPIQRQRRRRRQPRKLPPRLPHKHAGVGGDDQAAVAIRLNTYPFIMVHGFVISTMVVTLYLGRAQKAKCAQA